MRDNHASTPPKFCGVHQYSEQLTALYGKAVCRRKLQFGEEPRMLQYSKHFACLMILGLLLCLPLCRPISHSNFGLENWSASQMDGQEIKLAELEASGIIINFYSPICQPCIAELPALELLYQKIQNQEKLQPIAMFIGLEAHLPSHGISEAKADLSAKQKRQLISRRMQQDQKAYGISIPIIIMNENFRIGPDKLVRATPETLFLQSKPLRVQYNFVGALSTARTKSELLRDTRLQFVMEQLEAYQ